MNASAPAARYDGAMTRTPHVVALLRRRAGVGAALCALALIGGAVALGAGSPVALGARTPGDRLLEGGDRALAIGATPSGLAGTDAAACEPCHAELVAEWRGSLHAASWTDPVFQAAYAVEPLAFCRNCHAPLHREPGVDGVAASEGISCAVCHIRDGVILGAGRREASAAPHPVRVDERLRTSGFCAPCHDFGFLSGGLPGHPRRETTELQQSTFTEWQTQRDRAGEGAAAVSECQGCHMDARGEGPARHAGHAFPGRLDPAFVASAVAVGLDVARDGAAVTVTARVTPRAVGHSMPTGDLYRRLELRVWVDGDERHAARLDYARSFADRRDASFGAVRYEAGDTRVGEPGSEARTLRLEAAPGASLGWRLDYLLMPATMARAHGVTPEANVTRLREGVLVAP